MKPTPHEDGIRQKVVIENENFYLVVGEKFTQCTVPFENRPDQFQLRKTVEKVCEIISAMQRENGTDQAQVLRILAQVCQAVSEVMSNNVKNS